MNLLKNVERWPSARWVLRQRRSFCDVRPAHEITRDGWKHDRNIDRRFSSTPRCLHAGRFKDRAAATEAAEWLQARGAELHDIRHEERRVVKNYRVYLPAASDSAAAKAKLRELRGRGIRDVAIIAHGTSANRISLGLYRSAKNAKRRVAQLKKLGYPAKSAANTGKITEYAVQARIGGTRSALEAAWSEKFAGNPVRYADCP